MLSIITEKTKKILISSKFRNLIFILFIIFLSVGLFEALILSPRDYLQSDSVRIMYVHVPSCLLYTSPSPRDVEESRMPSSA